MNQDEEIVKLKKTVALMRKRLDTHDKLSDALHEHMTKYEDAFNDILTNRGVLHP